jgi:hypothetical protein
MPRNIFGEPYNRLADLDNKIKLINAEISGNQNTNINLQIDALISKNLDQDLTIANIESEITIIENNITSINSQISTITSKNTEQDTEIQNIENNISTINTNINAIENINIAQDTQIQNIITVNTNQDVSITSINSQISNIITTNSNHDASITSINTQLNNINNIIPVEIVNPLRDSAGNIFTLDTNKSYSVKVGGVYHISYNCNYTSIGSAVGTNTVRLLLPTNVTSNQNMYAIGNITLTGMTGNYRINCNPNSTYCTIVDQTGANITVTNLGAATKQLIANIIIIP